MRHNYRKIPMFHAVKMPPFTEKLLMHTQTLLLAKVNNGPEEFVRSQAKWGVSTLILLRIFSHSYNIQVYLFVSYLKTYYFRGKSLLELRVSTFLPN